MNPVFFDDTQSARAAGVEAWISMFLDRMASHIGISVPKHVSVSTEPAARPWGGLYASDSKSQHPHLAVYIWPRDFYLRDGAPTVQVALNSEFVPSKARLLRCLRQTEWPAAVSIADDCLLTVYRKLVWANGAPADSPEDIPDSVRALARSHVRPQHYLWVPNPLIAWPIRTISPDGWTKVTRTCASERHFAFEIGKEWSAAQCLADSGAVESEMLHVAKRLWNLVRFLSDP